MVYKELPGSAGQGGGAGMGYYNGNPPPAPQYFVPPSVPPLVSVPPIQPASDLASDLNRKAMQQSSLSTLANTARNYGYPAPEYEVRRVGGKDHRPIYRCTVAWNGTSSMHETATSGSKMQAKRSAALAMINRLVQHGMEVSHGIHKTARQPIKQYPQLAQQQQQYQVQQVQQGQQPSFFIDRGNGNLNGSTHHRYQQQRGLNYPSRNNASGSGMARPTTVKADPYANDIYSNHLPAGDNRNAYGNGNMRHPSGRNGANSYERDQVNRRNHQLAHRGPLYNNNHHHPRPAEPHHSRTDPQDNGSNSQRTAPPPNRNGNGHNVHRNSMPYRTTNAPTAIQQASPQPQYNQNHGCHTIAKSEPVGQPARYASSGGSGKLGNNTDLPSVPRRPNNVSGHANGNVNGSGAGRSNGNGKGIGFGASRDPRQRKTVFGGVAPTRPPPAPKTDSVNNDNGKKSGDREVAEQPKTHRYNLYKAAILGPKTKDNTATGTAPKNNNEPSAPQSRAPAPIKLKSSPQPALIAISKPQPVTAEPNKPINATKPMTPPATNTPLAKNMNVPSSLSASFVAQKTMAIAKAPNAKSTDSASGAKSTATAATAEKEMPAPKAVEGTRLKKDAPSKDITPAAGKTAVPPHAAPVPQKSQIGDKMVISPTKKKDGPAMKKNTEQPAETAKKNLLVKKNVNIETTRSESVAPLKVKNVPMKKINVEALRTRGAPLKFRNAPMKKVEAGRTEKIKNVHVKKVETARRENAPLKTENVAIKDVNIEAPRSESVPEKVTEWESPVKSVIKKEVLATKQNRTWEITPPPRRSSRNRTAAKKMTEEPQRIEPLPQRRTRSMKDYSNKRNADAMVDNDNSNRSKKPSPKAARVDKTEKDKDAEPDMVKMFETGTIKEESEKSRNSIQPHASVAKKVAMEIINIDSNANSNDNSNSNANANGSVKTAGVWIKGTPRTALRRSGIPLKKRPRSYQMTVWIYANGDELSVYELVRMATWYVEPFMNVSVHVYGTTTHIPTPQISASSRRSITHEMEHEVHPNAVYSVVAAKAATQAVKLEELRKDSSNRTYMGNMDHALSRCLIVSSNKAIVAATEGVTLVKANSIDKEIAKIVAEYRAKYDLTPDS